MSILINKNTRLLIQGITGHEGLFHARQMVQFGTNIVAGVTPGKGGAWILNEKVPVFDTVKMAVETTGANASVIFVPARFAADAIIEAAASGVPLIFCISEGVPVQDMVRVKYYLQRTDARLIGPNCPGAVTPGEAKVGIIPNAVSFPGNIGIVSRSGTLTYEVMNSLHQAGFGASTCVGIGGDPVAGTNFVQILEMFEADPHTDQVVLIGEIGGTEEEKAAEFIAERLTKPVIAFIAGQSAPAGKRMGHAGAIIERGLGEARDKIHALEQVGVKVARYPEEIAQLVGDL